MQNLMLGTGLRAAIYTEITDVEGEVNGFLTYDRQVVKIRPEPGTDRQPGADRGVEGAATTPARSTLPVNAPRLAAGDDTRLHQPVPAAPEQPRRSPRWSRRQPGAAEERRHVHGPRRAWPTRSCYSFESVNFPGQFLRHAASRVQNSRQRRLGTAAGRRHLVRPNGPDGLGRLPGVLELPRLLSPPLQLGGLALQRGRWRGPTTRRPRGRPSSTWNIAAPWAP